MVLSPSSPAQRQGSFHGSLCASSPTLSPQGGEQQQLGVGQHRTGQHRVTLSWVPPLMLGLSEGCSPSRAGPASCSCRYAPSRARPEHPPTPPPDLCQSCALSGMHRALVVYVTRIDPVVLGCFARNKHYSLLGAGEQRSPEQGLLARDTCACCPAVPGPHGADRPWDRG